jgi:hypothetical protein
MKGQRVAPAMPAAATASPSAAPAACGKGAVPMLYLLAQLFSLLGLLSGSDKVPV